jgi:hypothetical protein
VSDHPADQNSASDIAPSVSAGSTAPDMTEIESPKLAPEAGDGVVVDPPKADTARHPGKVMIMAPSRGEGGWQNQSWQEKARPEQSWHEKSWHEKSWEDAVFAPEPEPDPASAGLFGRSQVSTLAAVIMLAATTGAIGGAFATAGVSRLFANNEPTATIAQARSLEDSIARIDADLAALKIGTERAGRQNATQFGKTADRLDKVEKAQAEPLAKLAKLSEAIEKLRPQPPAPTPTPVASVPAKDVTGSIPGPVQGPVPTPTPKPEIARLPTVDGWILRDVADGGATIEGRLGIFEVYAGDPVPGLGRVDAIRKQDGRWVVVTSRGLIVGR